MARFNFLGRAVDFYGNIKPGIGITIYLTGTTTPATVYTERTGGSGLATAPQITSDDIGRFNFYVDEGDYPFVGNQKFDIVAGGITYEDIEIMRGVKIHHSLEELADDDHPQYASLAQNETVTGMWQFTKAVSGGITPTKDNHLTRKDYIDLLTDTNINSVSAASDEADQRHKEWADEAFTYERNTTEIQINTERAYTNSQIASVSGASDEKDQRHLEWSITEFTSTSAASREQDQRLTENILSVSADARSASASSLEQDQRLTENILSVSASSKEQDNRLDENITLLENLHVDKAEPTGFVTRTGSSISFSDGTGILSLTGTYDYYIKGVKYSGTGADSSAIDGTIGNHFFYIDSSGVINITKVFDVAVLLKNNAYIASVYWAGSKHIYLGDERHGITWDWNIHAYHHVLEGTKFESGLGLSDIQADENGSENNHAQLGVGQGKIWDEDLDHTTSEVPCASFVPVFYRIDPTGTWSYDIPSGVKATFPVKSFDDFDGSDVRLAYNQYTGGAWQQTEVPDLDYVLAHLFAINDTSRGIIAVEGQNYYATLPAAREGANTEMLNLSIGTLPFQEMLPIATVIYQTRTSYLNLINARIVKTDEGDDYIDFRQFKGTSTGGTNIDNHGNLAGLSGDDHLQYAMLNGLRDFTGTVGGVVAVADTDFPQKLYVDAVSASSVEQDNREREATNVQILSVSAASREQDTRLTENILSLSAASDEADIRLKEYTNNLVNTQIISVSGSSDEADQRHLEWAETTFASTSAASDEADQRHLEWAITEFASTSAASDEADQRLTENILSLSAASDEADQRHLEWAETTFASTSAASVEQDNRLQETIDALDHGVDLAGLEDDDHTQYLLVNGSRAMTGQLDMNSNDIVRIDNLTFYDNRGTSTLYSGHYSHDISLGQSVLGGGTDFLSFTQLYFQNWSDVAQGRTVNTFEFWSDKTSSWVSSASEISKQYGAQNMLDGEFEDNVQRKSLIFYKKDYTKFRFTYDVPNGWTSTGALALFQGWVPSGPRPFKIIFESDSDGTFTSPVTGCSESITEASNYWNYIPCLYHGTNLYRRITVELLDWATATQNDIYIIRELTSFPYIGGVFRGRPFYTDGEKLKLREGGTSVNEFSTDGTLAGDSDDAIPTEKSVKTYVDTELDQFTDNKIGELNSGVTVNDEGTGTINISADGAHVAQFKENVIRLLPNEPDTDGRIYMGTHTPAEGGYFEIGPSAALSPSGTAPLQYNGNFYATKVYNAVWG